MKSSRNITGGNSKPSLIKHFTSFNARKFLTNRGVLAAVIVFYAAICTPAMFASLPTPSASPEPSSSTLSGTVTVEIPSGKGTLRVILPDDMRPGDTITGTVIAAKGTVEGEVIDVKTVDGEVVATKRAGGSKNSFTFTVPANASRLSLSTAGGEHTPAVQFAINTAAPAGNFSNNIPSDAGPFAPRLGQTGRDITIPGNFDGSAANTTVNVGGKGLPVIAESPRKVIVRIPADTPTGPSNISVSEGNNSKTTPFNVVSLGLSADKLNLQRGEKTDLHISVTGLEGLKDNSGSIKLQVENVTPQVVSLTSNPAYQSNSNAGAMPTRVVNTDGGNTIKFTEQLTGVNPGAFTINATLFVPWRDLIHEAVRRYWEEKLNAIAKLKEAAAETAKKGKGNSKVPKDLLDNANKVKDLAKNPLWDPTGEKLLLDLQKTLQKEKDELTRIQRVIGAGSDTGKEIQKIKDELDKMAKSMGITLGK